MPSAQEKSLLYLSLKRFLSSGPAGNECPFPSLLWWITKADEQHSSKNADSRERVVFLWNMFVLLKASSEGRQALPAVWAAGWPPSSPAPHSPGLAKNHFCTKPGTNRSGLPLVPQCQQSIPAQDETKCQHPRIFHKKRNKCPFLVSFSHSLCMSYCFFT